MGCVLNFKAEFKLHQQYEILVKWDMRVESDMKKDLFEPYQRLQYMYTQEKREHLVMGEKAL